MTGARVAPSAPRATAIYVAYGVDRLDTEWIPPECPVIVVHNDARLSVDSVSHPRARHLRTGGNVGFGAAINAALALVTTPRVVLCNPDTRLVPEHWQALAQGQPDEVVVVPHVTADGVPASVINRYPTPLTLALMAWRVGRLAPRGSRRRRLLSHLLGTWGRMHREGMDAGHGSWSLASHWATAAVLSVDTARLRDIGGFDPGYFLYFEDVDLCRRLARRHPAMRLVVPATEPAVHLVGGSASSTLEQRTAEHHRLASALRYCRSQSGWSWRLSEVFSRIRGAFRRRSPSWRAR